MNKRSTTTWLVVVWAIALLLVGCNDSASRNRELNTAFNDWCASQSVPSHHLSASADGSRISYSAWWKGGGGQLWVRGPDFGGANGNGQKLSPTLPLPLVTDYIDVKNEGRYTFILSVQGVYYPSGEMAELGRVCYKPETPAGQRVEVVVDSTPPVIMLGAPYPVEPMPDGRLMVRGAVVDKVSAITSVTIDGFGNQILPNDKGYFEVFVDPEELPTMQFTPPQQPVLTVRAVDAAGLSSVMDFPVPLPTNGWLLTNDWVTEGRTVSLKWVSGSPDYSPPYAPIVGYGVGNFWTPIKGGTILASQTIGSWSLVEWAGYTLAGFVGLLVGGLLSLEVITEVLLHMAQTSIKAQKETHIQIMQDELLCKISALIKDREWQAAVDALRNPILRMHADATALRSQASLGLIMDVQIPADVELHILNGKLSAALTEATKIRTSWMGAVSRDGLVLRVVEEYIKQQKYPQAWQGCQAYLNGSKPKAEEMIAEKWAQYFIGPWLHKRENSHRILGGETMAGKMDATDAKRSWKNTFAHLHTDHAPMHRQILNNIGIEITDNVPNAVVKVIAYRLFREAQDAYEEITGKTPGILKADGTIVDSDELSRDFAAALDDLGVK